MRLMLGFNGNPSLLVDVTKYHSDGSFDFWVVNGAWDGVFNKGIVTVNYTKEDIECTILTDNQDRLRGSYEEVFANFHNESYVAPMPLKHSTRTWWDDDVPF